ncbi:uncharacterized protein PHALS_14014 [Plasmopara halstedii]|uniref:RxLR-like protein n=1 Tax=Plasmopara halstedii TaxID=4781 RepID=A0A0P1AS15_PLAHL|nr:uncharacterized protein PHALS_14014 [Plasmopara halstedii]CEG43720.1 hypothetical protein PHALS_14014 [Plasmopara halstedii]|eukprot:XP_024580089.1 hypothetical protein PHALS_14014 [Plasmopara halstedii]
MKSVAFLSLVTLTASVVADTKSTTFPGRCETTKDCLTYGSNYACISVDTSVAGLERLSMCIPGAQVCSGRIAGLCPTFTTWPSKYRVIQPICAFVEVDNCDEMYNVTISSHAGSNGTVDDDTDVSISSANGTGTVQCYQRNFTVNNDYVVVNGIYQCLDKAKFVNQNGGHIKNITDTILLRIMSANVTLATILPIIALRWFQMNVAVLRNAELKECAVLRKEPQLLALKLCAMDTEHVVLTADARALKATTELSAVIQQVARLRLLPHRRRRLWEWLR